MFCYHGKQSVHVWREKTGFSQSSVYRLQHGHDAMRGHGRRWETEAGCDSGFMCPAWRCSIHLVSIAVGARIRCRWFSRGSTGRRRGVLRPRPAPATKTSEATMRRRRRLGEARSATGGDRHYWGGRRNLLDQMVLVFHGSPLTGYIILEETADERSYATCTCPRGQAAHRPQSPGALPGGHPPGMNAGGSTSATPLPIEGSGTARVVGRLGIEPGAPNAYPSPA